MVKYVSTTLAMLLLSSFVFAQNSQPDFKAIVSAQKPIPPTQLPKQTHHVSGQPKQVQSLAKDKTKLGWSPTCRCSNAELGSTLRCTCGQECPCTYTPLWSNDNRYQGWTYIGNGYSKHENGYQYNHNTNTMIAPVQQYSPPWMLPLPSQTLYMPSFGYFGGGNCGPSGCPSG